MPFGPFTDFKDCVRKNQDKRNPEAWCAIVHKKITGKFPAEMAEYQIGDIISKIRAKIGGHPAFVWEFNIVNRVTSKTVLFEVEADSEEDAKRKAIELATSSFGFNVSETDIEVLGLVSKRPFSEYKDGGVKLIQNAEIFKVGTHTDSDGQTTAYQDKDLNSMMEAFEAGVPEVIPIKLGHSSPEFSDKVAEALDIPKDVLLGEPGTKDGQARLGKVDKLIRKNGSLVASFEVPEKVAELIKGGLFTDTSVEVFDKREQDGKTFGPVISAVALLGAERPAVKGISGLANVTILADGSRPDKLFVSKFQFQPGTTGKVDGGVATSSDKGTKGLWDVIVADQKSGSRVSAIVSSPNEVSAKRTGLRVVETFLLSLVRPIGSIAGAAIGGVIAGRFIAKAAKKAPLGSILGTVSVFSEKDEPLDVMSLYEEVAQEAYDELSSNIQVVRLFQREVSVLGKVLGRRGRGLITEAGGALEARLKGANRVRVKIRKGGKIHTETFQIAPPFNAKNLLEAVNSDKKTAGGIVLAAVVVSGPDRGQGIGDRSLLKEIGNINEFVAPLILGRIGLAFLRRLLLRKKLPKISKLPKPPGTTMPKSQLDDIKKALRKKGIRKDVLIRVQPTGKIEMFPKRTLLKPRKPTKNGLPQTELEKAIERARRAGKRGRRNGRRRQVEYNPIEGLLKYGNSEDLRRAIREGLLGNKKEGTVKIGEKEFSVKVLKAALAPIIW